MTERSLQALRQGAEPVEVRGNKPVRIDRAGAAWLIETGGVEVFAVRTREGEPVGARMHLLSLAPGELMLGVDGDGAAALLASGGAGTRVLELSAGRLEKGDGGDSAVFVDRWLSQLSGTMLPGPAPRRHQALEPGQEVDLGDDRSEEDRGEDDPVVRSREGVVWVEILDGSARWMGREDLPEATAGELVPISDSAWLSCSPSSRLRVLDTAELLSRADAGAHLAAFHQVFLTAVVERLERRTEDERQRLDRKAGLDQETLGGAFTRLASVLEPAEDEDVEEVAKDAPLIAACRLAGQANGIAFKTPTVELPKTAKTETRLVQICTVSSVRSRKVILKGDWWNHDNGALVAFRVVDPEEKIETPVALVPVSPTRYEMVDPVDQARTPVDEEVADSLSGVAYMFYPPLPDRPLTAIDLIRQGLRNQRPDLQTLVMMGLAGGLLGLVVPILTAQLFGQVIPRASRLDLVQLAAALVVSALAAGIFQVTRSIAILRLGGRMDGALQSAVWDRLLRLPVSFFRNFTVGDLTNRSMGINSIRELFTGNVTTSMLTAVFSLFSFALLFYYSWRLALLGTLLIAVLVAVTVILVYRQIAHHRKLLTVQGKLQSLLFELIDAIGKLRIAGAERRAFALWAGHFSKQRQHTIDARKIANVQSAFNASYKLIMTLSIFAMVGLSAQADLGMAEFLAFNAAFGQFTAAALSMISVFTSVLTMGPIFDRLKPLLEAVPESDSADAADPGELRGEIELSHVSFRYQEDGPLILNDVSLRAEPGEFIALVGPSGSGKSTCLRLMLAFEKPLSGSVYFDGQDLTKVNLREVRRQIGVVLQSGRLMSGDIATNILGSSGLTVDDAWEAARMAGLDVDIKQMPMGMHTVVSEGAGTFSGGQKQRLMIARAIVSRPRILLFDEATSALDNRTQEIVSQSLERLKATRVVIAHRLSTILNADRIYVIAAGRVVESGSYDELMKQDGVFAELAQRQIA